MRRLTIISHTKHYHTIDGTVVGWGATVTEINHLLDIFDDIKHIAMVYDEIAPPSAIPYASNKIHFIQIPTVGGRKISDKFSIVTKAPKIIKIINDALRDSDYFQFRAPTGIGVFVIPYLIFFNTNKGWFKYAGNWKQENAPLAYNFQKWMLKNQNRKVTINGFWTNQPNHCLSFQNPCLSKEELEAGIVCIKEKNFEPPLNFCFVGRLESAKGLDIILDAFDSLDDLTKKKIGSLHLVGDGDRLAFYKKKAKSINVEIIFHGLLSRIEVQEIYKKSHAIVLPSASEGFPKVIMEALNFGCVPIVSNISSIGHYIIDGKNGFLLEDISTLALKNILHLLLSFKTIDLNEIINDNADLINSFTYDHYNSRLLKYIL